MNIYIDFAKGKIEKVTPAPIYFGDNNVDKITLYFKNIADGVEWYPTLSALCSDNNPIYPRLFDTDGTGTITIDGVDYTYYEFTLSSANGWNLTPGRTLFYVWINYPNTNGNKCVGTFGCTILGTSGYYKVDNLVVNPELREYLESSFEQQYNEIDEKFNSLEEEFNDEYTEEVNAQRDLINNLIGGEPRYVNTSSNILALTSNRGVAVATDNGHWYYWNGTQYVDGGVYLSNSTGLTYGGLNAVNNVDNCASNTFYWFGSSSGVLNMPVDHNLKCLVECIGIPNSTYFVQKFTDELVSYYRVNAGGTFSNWRKLNDIYVNSNLAPYSDFDNAPVNTIAWQTGAEANSPIATIGLLETLGLNDSYLIQRYTTVTNDVYLRTKRSTFNSWIQLNSNKIKYDSYKIFKKVGCIGDSYTAGWIANPSGIGYTDHTGYSWVDYISKDSGNNYVNFGVSGARCKTWLDNTGGAYSEAQNNICQAYIIGMGINDTFDYPVGTSSDIGTSTDSYYKWYYDLCVAIHNLNEDAPIFCFTLGNDTAPNGNTTAINTAIRYIVSTHGSLLNLYLVDLYNRKEDFDSAPFRTNKLSGHYTPVGYEGFAKIIEEELSKVIQNNPTDFYYVSYIEYDE